MRPIGFILRSNSPVLVVREVLWRIKKQWNKAKFRLRGRLDESPVHLCWPAYYQPNPAACSPRAAAAIVGVADLISCGQFPFLGYGTVNLGFPPRWDVDFVSGKEWPMRPAERLTLIRHDGSDVKVPWELSRLQFLPVLGKAYLLTAKEQYRTAAMRLLANWIEQNPLGVGVNWTVAMEPALRAMSICFLLNLLGPAREGEGAWFRNAELSLLEHLLFIEAHLEFSHLARGNHYLSNIVGLFCISTFLEGPGMQSRRQKYQRKVEEEILHQVYADGGDYEASTGYQVLVTQLFTTAYLLMCAQAASPQPSFVSRLGSMYGWMICLADSSGTLPHVGDCDDGRVELLFDDLSQMLNLSPQARNSQRVSSLLGLAPEFLQGATVFPSEDGCWYGMCRPRPRKEVDGRAYSPAAVTLLSQSGIAIARKAEHEVLFFALPNGIGGKGSHTHNDKLSVILRLAGEELLCDSGTCFYTRDAGTRNYFRSTGGHNTVVVDGCEQNALSTQPKALFCLGNDAAVSGIRWSEKDGVIRLQAAHFGYRRIGVNHSRSLVFSNCCLQIEDCFEGAGEHHFRTLLHLPPLWDVRPAQLSGTKVSFEVRGPCPVSIVLQAPAELNAIQDQVQLSRCYGTAFSGTRISVLSEAALPFSMSTRVSWN